MKSERRDAMQDEGIEPSCEVLGCKGASHVPTCRHFEEEVDVREEQLRRSMGTEKIQKLGNNKPPSVTERGLMKEKLEAPQEQREREVKEKLEELNMSLEEERLDIWKDQVRKDLTKRGFTEERTKELLDETCKRKAERKTASEVRHPLRVAEKAIRLLAQLEDKYQTSAYVELHRDGSGVFCVQKGPNMPQAGKFLGDEVGSVRWNVGVPVTGYNTLGFCHMKLDEVTPKPVTPPVSYPYEVVDQERVKRCFTYHRPKPGQEGKYVNLRFLARELAENIHCWCPPSRERSLALTKLEEAVMWANAAIARNE